MFRFKRPGRDVLPRKLIVGLGNPGGEYRNTRHNVGFHVVETLARRHSIPVDRKERQALVGRGLVRDLPVALAMPQTYMNLSGRSVASLLRLYQLSPGDLLVVTDDMDLPVGRLRLRATGSAGGHNGLRSLIDELGTEEFARLRIGVGRPAGDQAIRHVLGKFGPEERESIQAAIERAADAAEVAVCDGLTAAMDRFNTRAARPGGSEGSAAED